MKREIHFAKDVNVLESVTSVRMDIFKISVPKHDYGKIDQSS